MILLKGRVERESAPRGGLRTDAIKWPDLWNRERQEK